MISLVLLAGFVVLASWAAPRTRKDHDKLHGAGQIGMLAALALFGVDYFTSFYYATGEMMSSLHPFGLQQYAYVAAAVIAFANLVFGGLYMFSLGPFNEGGGSYTASMRYLWPTASLIVAITLVEDYVLTIVVSALSGGDQLLSILGAYGTSWGWHFAIGAALAALTWFLTIRGRGESAHVVFILIGVFALMTLTMAGGLVAAHLRGVPPVAAEETPQAVSLGRALLHMLTAAMKGMVALTGLEAVSNGVQFFIHEDVRIVRWGKRRLPRLKRIWDFFSGGAGIGRFVQSSFLFYGGMTTLLLTFFSLRFHVFDGTAGRTLVGNLAFIGFSEIPGGIVLFWAYQILAVAMLAAASMTAFQDAQATEWRDVAIGEIPEAVIYRDKRGTFTRSVTFTFVAAILIMLLVRGQTTHAIPFYTIGVFLPITAMGLSIRRHILAHYTGRARQWGARAAGFAAGLSAFVFLGQIFGKWEEGGWIRLISFSILFTVAHLVLVSPAGYRDPRQIHRIVREKARVEGAMASIVEWQAFRMQEYRFRLLLGLASLLESLRIRQRPWQPAWARAGNGDGRGPIRPPARMASLAGLAPVTTGRLPTDQGTKADSRPFHLPPRIVRHRVLVPVNGVHQGTLTALRYAHSISQDVTAVHVSLDAEETEELQRGWATWGEGVRLVVLPSPHQLVLEPLLQYIGGLMARRQDNEILTVVVPQSVRPQWWSNLLRTQMAVLLRLSLPFETGIVITDVPYDVETPLLPVGGAGANRRQE